MPDQPLPFSHKLRIRACGLFVVEESVLLAQIQSPITDKLVWMPPGGGVAFGETIEACLMREFEEETNLKIEVKDLIHCNELIEPPYHALEYYFEVEKIDGELKKGTDPELPDQQQLLKDVQWIPISKLQDYAFAPQNLLKKIMDWQHRFAFQVFPRGYTRDL